MTPFMERVTEVVTGGERGGSPGTRPSEPRPVVIGASSAKADSRRNGGGNADAARPAGPGGA